MKKFEINIKDLKFAGSELDISRTIEFLLDINDLIPKRVDSPRTSITQKQLDESQKRSGEKDCVTEIQLERDDREDLTFEILEVKSERAKPEFSGHNSKTWKPNDKKIRGHKDVPPLWQIVYKNEKNREKGEVK